MASKPDPKKQEHPSTYMVQDRSNQDELVRLEDQDQMFTRMMGGVLSEQGDVTRLRRVLDVACGPGGWLIQTARAYPTIVELRGVDVSAKLIEQARAQAEAANVSDRVQFQTGDALRKLDFRDNTFDLVNQRFAASFLRKWDWPNLLREYQRVCLPGGTIRISEMNLASENSSPALARLESLLQEAFFNAGHMFTAGPDGVTAHIAEQMEKYGVIDVQTKRHTFAFHTEPQALAAIVQDAHRLYRNLVPFLRKWTKLPADYEEIYQQMLHETTQPGFQLTHSLLTAWGTSRV